MNGALCFDFGLVSPITSLSFSRERKRKLKGKLKWPIKLFLVYIAVLFELHLFILVTLKTLTV